MAKGFDLFEDGVGLRLLNRLWKFICNLNWSIQRLENNKSILLNKKPPKINFIIMRLLDRLNNQWKLRLYQTSFLIFTLIVLEHLDDKINNYHIERLKLSFYNTQITLLSFIQLNWLMLLVLGLISLSNLVGFIYEKNSESGKMVLAEEERSTANVIISLFFAITTVFMGECALLFLGYMARKYYSEDLIEVTTNCSSDECKTMEDSWTYDGFLLTLVLILHSFVFILEAMKILNEFLDMFCKETAKAIRSISFCPRKEKNKEELKDELEVSEADVFAVMR